MDMPRGKRKNNISATLLVLAAFIWGTAFVAQSVGMDHIGPCTFNATRSFIGSAALLPVISVFSKRGQTPAQPKKEKRCWLFDRSLLIGGGACGLMLTGGSLLQQMGLVSTTAGKAGFLTSLYIVIVPVLGIFLHRRPGVKVWLGVVLALAGAWLLSGATGGEAAATGDLLVIASAVFFSLHILVIDHFSPKVDGVQLSCVQFFVAGCLSLVFALIFERPALPDLIPAWGPLLYTGVLSSGVAYTLQIVGQKGLNPTVASLLMSLESVFAALSGWVVLRQPLSPRELLGCALVFAAVILAQLPGRRDLPMAKPPTA